MAKKRGMDKILYFAFLAKAIILFFILYFEIFFQDYFLSTPVFTTLDISLRTAADLWKNDHYFNYYASALMIVIAAVVLFILTIRKINEIKPLKIRPKMWFLIVSHIVFVVGFISLDLYIINPHSSQSSYLLLLIIRYALMFMLATTLLQVFFSKTLFPFMKKFYPQTIVSLVLGWVFMNTYFYIQKLWPYLSFIVGKTVYFLLSLIYDGVSFLPSSTYQDVFYENVPTVSVGDFAAIIFKTCSGIEGLSLFLLLFTVIIIVEWPNLIKRRAFLLYPIGIAIMFLVNILRIFILLIAGIEISPAFASGAFHSHFGWIFFAIVFVIFEYFSYGWMAEKK